MTHRYSMIVPYGENTAAIEAALELLPVEKVIVITPPGVSTDILNRTREYLATRGILMEVIQQSGDSPDAIFQTLAEVKSREGVQKLLVNVSFGRPLYSHLMVCAAMANGITTIGVFENQIVFLPISCSITHGK